jgi:two-component system OmpR family sensor kinase
MSAIADLLRRVPFRVRLALIFAAVMVVLFGGLALLLYTRFAANLDTAGVSQAQRQHALASLGQLLFIGGPAMLVLTCLAGYALTARALAPVEKMRRRATRISGADRGDRLPVPEANDELHRLGTTLNEMLGRLEEAMERERAFVANAGHELRTPLSILQLQLEDLEQSVTASSPRDELEQGLSSAREEVERLAKLAEDLLVLARADRAGLPVEKQPVQVPRLLHDVAERVGTAANGEGRAVIAGPAEVPTVLADAAWLEQALANMASNALQHGAGQVRLLARQRNGSVELHVLDEGRGFPPGFLSQAFDRFTRGDAARSSGGAGLGLLIVRAIAEAHGGRAGAANRECGGADVWLLLPIGSVEAPSESLPPAEGDADLRLPPAAGSH